MVRTKPLSQVFRPTSEANRPITAEKFAVQFRAAPGFENYRTSEALPEDVERFLSKQTEATAQPARVEPPEVPEPLVVAQRALDDELFERADDIADIVIYQVRKVYPNLSDIEVSNLYNQIRATLIRGTKLTKEEQQDTLELAQEVLDEALCERAESITEYVIHAVAEAFPDLSKSEILSLADKVYMAVCNGIKLTKELAITDAEEKPESQRLTPSNVEQTGLIQREVKWKPIPPPGPYEPSREEIIRDLIASGMSRREAEVLAGKVRALYHSQPWGTSKERSRPPKRWWDNCIARAEEFADDPAAYCGWLWHHGEEEGFGAQREAFGKSEDISDRISMDDVYRMYKAWKLSDHKKLSEVYTVSESGGTVTKKELESRLVITPCAVDGVYVFEDDEYLGYYDDMEKLQKFIAEWADKRRKGSAEEGERVEEKEIRLTDAKIPEPSYRSVETEGGTRVEPKETELLSKEVCLVCKDSECVCMCRSGKCTCLEVES